MQIFDRKYLIHGLALQISQILFEIHYFVFNHTIDFVKYI